MVSTPPAAPRIAAAALFATFIGAVAVLLRFAFSGPFTLILPVHSPVNAQAVIGVSFVLLVFLGAPPKQGRKEGATDPPRSLLWSVPLTVAAAAPFLVTLNAPLLHDSYAHVAEAARARWPEILSVLTHPSANDLFFRPLGYLSYWLDYKWADSDPVRWHIWNLIVHTANTWLVFVLATELALSRLSAALAALVFALHGTRPEVVSWAAARFDLLAAFFVLLSLVALNRYLTVKRARWYVVMVACAVLAVLSKEAAFCLPFLAAGSIAFKNKTQRPDIVRAAAVLLAVCGAVFLYRYWVVGGFGGYRTAAGEPAVLQFNIIHTLKGLFFRQWSFLFFPINWSTGPGVWVKTSLVIMLGAMIALIAFSHASRYILISAIAFEILAAVPVQHLLLMTADLAGSRILYLPVLGLAIFWGVLIQGCRHALLRNLIAAILVIFELAALCHNLETWRRAAFLSQRTCRAMGAELQRDPRPILVRDLPAKWNGVFFLRNGFPQCVEINSHQPASRLYIKDEGPPPPAGARILTWNDETQQFDEIGK